MCARLSLRVSLSLLLALSRSVACSPSAPPSLLSGWAAHGGCSAVRSRCWAWTAAETQVWMLLVRAATVARAAVRPRPSHGLARMESPHPTLFLRLPLPPSLSPPPRPPPLSESLKKQPAAAQCRVGPERSELVHKARCMGPKGAGSRPPARQNGGSKPRGGVKQRGPGPPGDAAGPGQAACTPPGQETATAPRKSGYRRVEPQAACSEWSAECATSKRNKHGAHDGGRPGSNRGPHGAAAPEWTRQSVKLERCPTRTWKPTTCTWVTEVCTQAGGISTGSGADVGGVAKMHTRRIRTGEQIERRWRCDAGCGGEHDGDKLESSRWVA